MAESTDPTQADDASAPVVRTASRFSVVWLIPLVAVGIGGWLAWKAWSEQGPTITISFKTAEGLAAGKTKIKFKDVEVGEVTAVDLSEDLEHVVVTAKLDKGAEPYVREKTRFWVVRARVAAGEVSGLSTLFSGAYIGMEPALEGKRNLHFVGLEQAPMVTLGEQGSRFLLRSEALGSLDVGSPLYYRKIKVGRVVRYALSKDEQQVDLTVFIDAPHDRKITVGTKFWNASGLDVRVDSSGITVDSESLVTVLLGGIAFEPNPTGDQVEATQVFHLYDSKESAYQRVYTERKPFILYFKDSVRGLVPGSSVDFRGIRIGEVKQVRLEGDLDTMELRIPVLVEIESQRIAEIGVASLPKEEQLKALVRRGLRGQLKTANLVTGQLRIELDFHPDAPAAELGLADGVPVMPTVPSPLGEITTNLTSILQKLEQLPLEQIGNDLRDTMHNAKTLSSSDVLLNTMQAMRDTMEQTRQLAATLNAKLSPAVDATVADLDRTLSAASNTVQRAGKTMDELDATLVQANKTLVAAEDVISVDSPLYIELTATIQEMRETARSIRSLSNYLERNPDALLRGKRAR